MSVLASLQQLLHDGALSPPRLRLATSHEPSARVTRTISASAPTLSPPCTPPQYSPLLQPFSAPVTSRRLSPLLSTRSPLFSPPFHASRWLLLGLACVLHAGIILAVWYLFFSPSSTLPVTAEPLISLSHPTVERLHYTPPISLLSLGKRDRATASHPVPNSTVAARADTAVANGSHPVTSSIDEPTLARKDTSASPPTPLLSVADEREPRQVAAVQIARTPTPARPLPAKQSASLLSFTQGLQQASCSPSSSPSLLVYDCLANAVHVEHSEEEYFDQHLGGVYALPRALLMAVATQRALVLDQSQCNAVAQLNDTRARQAGLTCCVWQQHLQPLTTCNIPATTLATAVQGVSPFSIDTVVAYDVRQQCLWTDEVWDRVSRMFPQQSSLSVMQTLTSLLLQPSLSMSTHLTALRAELQLGEEGSLALHLPPFTAKGDEAQQLTFSRYLPVSTYLSYIRNHAATSSLTPSTLLLWASDNYTTAAQEALPHLRITPVLPLMRAYWQGKDELPLTLFLSLILLLSAHVTEWVGLHASVVTQLVQMRAERQLRVWDVHGDEWTPSCWSSSPHLLTAHHAEARGYNNPALTSLLSSSPSSPAPLLAPTQLILVLGSLRSGVEAVNRFLGHHKAITHDDALSDRWTDLFAPRGAVDSYHEHRTAFLAYLRTLLTQPRPPARVLMWYKLPLQTERDLSLSNHHHAAWLAQELNEMGWAVSLKVVVMVREAEEVMRNAVWDEVGMISMKGDGQQALLPIGRPIRDVLAAIESECEAMDVSVYRTFLYPRLVEEAKEEEARRLASFLDFNATESDAFALHFVQQAEELRAMMKPPQAPRHGEDSRAISDLALTSPAMQLMNARHPSYQAETLNYRTALIAALQLQLPASTSFSAQLEAVQRASDCGAADVLLFDGFLRWTRATQVSTQVLDLLRSMSLALATGRVLVAPRVEGSVLEWLEPLSSCRADSLGLAEVTSTETGWIAKGWDDSVGMDPFSTDRVVHTHSQVIDVAYLAVWNGQRKEQGRRISVRDYVQALLSSIILPTAAFRDEHTAALTSSPADLMVILPVTHHRPLSSYEQSIDGLVSTLGIRSLTLTWTDAVFQHVAGPSFLSLLDMAHLPADTLGPAMAAAVAEHVQRRWPNISLHLLHHEQSRAKAELLLLTQASNLSRVLGSMGSELGFLTASLTPHHAWWDCFGDQYIPSLLALNHHNVLHTSPPSAKLLPLADPLFLPPVVEKKVFSSAVRFVFVAGLEGTGHHGVGHLLQGVRVYTEVGVWYRQVQVDEWLNTFGWKMMKEVNIIAWERYKRQLQQRLKWRVEQYSQNGEPLPIFVINTVQDCIGGMQSYPNTDLPDKTTLHPQLASLATMMEESGADLRVIALARTPGSSLASAVKRDHGVSLVGKENAFLYLARVARANLAALDLDIAAIDPRFTLTIATESIQTQPALVARAIARHIGLEPDELVQAALRMKEDVVVHPSSHWMSSMNDTAVQLTQDVLDISSHIPMSDQFAFAPGMVGGKDELRVQVQGEHTGFCRRKPMGLRHTPKDVLVVAMEGSGVDYLKTLVEEASAVMASTHVVDRVLPPSTAVHLDGFADDHLTAFRVLEYSIDQELNAAFPSPTSQRPMLILTRNPLDIALSVASRLMRGTVAVSDQHTWDFSRDHYSMWRREHMGELVTLVRATLDRVAQTYIAWTSAWKVAQRRQEMLQDGVSKDGVRVLRMEDFLTAPGRTLQELLDLFDLPADPSALDCVQTTAESMVFTARFMSKPTLEAWAKRTHSGHARLNESLSSLQHALAAASFPDHATASRPFRLFQLLPPDLFVSFRRSVEVVATSVEGPDWGAYCDEVEGQVRQHWATPPAAIHQPTRPMQPAAPAQPGVPITANSPNTFFVPPGQKLTSPDSIFAEARKLEGDLSRLMSNQRDNGAAANKARARLTVLRKLIQQLNVQNALAQGQHGG